MKRKLALAVAAVAISGTIASGAIAQTKVAQANHAFRFGWGDVGGWNGVGGWNNIGSGWNNCWRNCNRAITIIIRIPQQQRWW